MRRAAAIPLPGMLMSSKRTSGNRPSASATASSLEAPVPTIEKPSSRFRTAASASRTRAWSSTKAMRMPSFSRRVWNTCLLLKKFRQRLRDAGQDTESRWTREIQHTWDYRRTTGKPLTAHRRGPGQVRPLLSRGRPAETLRCQLSTPICVIPARCQRRRPVCRSGRGPKLRPTSECTHDLSLLPSLRPWFLVSPGDYAEVRARTVIFLRSTQMQPSLNQTRRHRTATHI